MSEALMYAGQYQIDAIEILQPNGLSLDIRDQVQQVTIYEDLFSPFMSGNIICGDSVDLPSYFMNSGADLLRLRLSTPTIAKEQWIDRYFHIYRLADRAVINSRAQTYIYYFVSQESIVDTSHNISKTFRGRGNDIVKSIMANNIGSSVPVNSSSTTNDITYTSNYWSATKNITYICDHSIAEDKTPSFLFFENRAGFQFKPLTELAKAKPFMEFKATDHITEVNTAEFGAGNISKNLSMDYSAILTLSMKVTYDYEKDKRNGMLNSRMFTFDLKTKKLSDTTFNLNQDTRPLLNPNRFYTKELIDASYRGTHGSVMLHNQAHTGLYNGVGDGSDFAYKQKRISLLRQFQQHKIEITVLGRTDYTVGMTVSVDSNRLGNITKDMSANEIQDPLISGKYIVAAVCHRFGRDGVHQCTLELIRDSIGAKL